MKTKVIAVVAFLVALGLGGWLVLQPDKVPHASGTLIRPSVWGGRFHPGPTGFAGFGWSVDPDAATAVRQALTAAGGGTVRRADITFVFYTPHHDPAVMRSQVEAALGPEAVFCGWSSDYGIVCPDGYRSSPEGVVGVLALRLPGMRVGVGAAELDEVGSPAACARLALHRAVDRAGASPDVPPSLILMSATYDGHEEEYLRAIAEEIGVSVPVLGGTAGGSQARGADDSSALAGGRVVRRGLVLAAFHSSQPFAWSFRGGFDRTSKSGTVTSSDGRVIRQIDGRPALDVYDEWSGGRVSQAMRDGKDLNTFTGLYPLCRTMTAGGVSHNLFVHAWPPDDAGNTRRLVTSANLWPGDTVNFSEGSWNILLNRIGALPAQARETRSDIAIRAGLFVCCEAVLKNIPADHRDQMARLINRSLGDVPWMGVFTWGEQGNFPDVGNVHGNLLTNITLFPLVEEGGSGP